MNESTEYFFGGFANARSFIFAIVGIAKLCCCGDTFAMGNRIVLLFAVATHDENTFGVAVVMDCERSMGRTIGLLVMLITLM